MKQVLVVDDATVIRKVARRILEDLDFGAAEAVDGEDGLAQCETRMPDAILLDWNMPGTDSVAFLSALRRMPGGRTPKVVLCISENEAGQIARALHAGANSYMMKPFDQVILTTKLREIGLL